MASQSDRKAYCHHVYPQEGENVSETTGYNYVQLATLQKAYVRVCKYTLWKQKADYLHEI